MPTIICLAGPTGAAKSELLVNLSTELSRRGKRVGIILDKSDQAPPGEPASAKGAALWLEGGMLRLKKTLQGGSHPGPNGLAATCSAWTWSSPGPSARPKRAR